MDRKKLEEELASATAREKEHKDVDEMKKRAITTAQSYEEFKNLVACASLKPLHREDFAKKAVTTSNRAAKPGDVGFGFGSSERKKDKASDLADALTAKLNLSKAGTAIKSARDFDTQWRRLKEGDRLSFLQKIEPHELVSIFRSEIDADVLSQILRVLKAVSLLPADEEGSNNQLAFCIRCLAALSKAGMFGMSCRLIEPADREIAIMLAKLATDRSIGSDLVSADDIETVESAYGGV